MRIALGSDHAGRTLRQAIGQQLTEAGHAVQDVGTFEDGATSYVSYAQKVCARVLGGDCVLGILVCGTGTGMGIAANKLAGIRAAVCTHEFVAHMARAHNNANILCLGERVTGVGVAEGIVSTFLSTQFAGGRHQARLDQLTSTLEPE
jgi:ribose 5-phosphate isomerase B